MEHNDNAIVVSSINQLIESVLKESSDWGTKPYPWFRGEPERLTNYRDQGNSEYIPLLPSLYRPCNINAREDELLQEFRIKAPMYLDIQIPQQGHTDQWLFLARHAGLPTRILDWTENLLYALHFAVNSKQKGAVVWMLDPIELNRLSDSDERFPITWFSPELDSTIWIRRLLMPDDRIRYPDMDYRKYFFENIKQSIPKHNIGNQNIRAAWESNKNIATELPIAIYPTYIHPRMTLQKSCFTIWGKNKKSLYGMDDRIKLKKFIIDDKNIPVIKKELRVIGITKTLLFSDLDSLVEDMLDERK